MSKVKNAMSLKSELDQHIDKIESKGSDPTAILMSAGTRKRFYDEQLAEEPYEQWDEWGDCRKNGATVRTYRGAPVLATRRGEGYVVVTEDIDWWLCGEES